MKQKWFQSTYGNNETNKPSEYDILKDCSMCTERHQYDELAFLEPIFNSPLHKHNKKKAANKQTYIQFNYMRLHAQQHIHNNDDLHARAGAHICVRFATTGMNWEIKKKHNWRNKQICF